MSKIQQPFFPYDPNERELTVKALVLGILMAVILGYANAWLGMKAGMTISAIFPATVVAMAVFKIPFFRGSNLEQNIARTSGTVGEALAAGAIFTIPAFILVSVDGQRLWTEFRYWETAALLLVGGLLGVLFTIFIRHPLCVEAELPFPESYACAEIAKAGQKGATGSKYIFSTMGIGMLIQLFKDDHGIKLIKEAVEGFKEFPSAVVKFLTEEPHKGGVAYTTPAASPALMGIGYIIGPKLAALSLAGGIIAWMVLIPLILFTDTTLAERLVTNGEFIGWASVTTSIWKQVIRPIAVGSMFVGGLYTLFKMRQSLITSVKGAFRKYTPAEVQAKESRDKDIPMKWVAIGIAILIIPITLIYYHFCQSIVAALIAMVIMVVAGYFLCAVGGYLVGIIGGSNQPVSGLTIIALLIAAVTMVAMGVKGLPGIAAVLGVAAVVCIATSKSGDLLQDLKVGHLLGGTPWKMEIAQIITTIIVSFVLIYSMIWLNQANAPTGGIGGTALPAPQANLMASLATGIVSGKMSWLLIFMGMMFSVALILLNAPSPMMIAIGMYLPFNTTMAIFAGGVIKWIVDTIAKKRKFSAEDNVKLENKGILLASGFIAGESLLAIIVAIPVILTGNSDWTVSNWLFGQDPSSFYESAGGWLSLIIFAIVAFALIKIPVTRDRERAK